MLYSKMHFTYSLNFLTISDTAITTTATITHPAHECVSNQFCGESGIPYTCLVTEGQEVQDRTSYRYCIKFKKIKLILIIILF
jgi:hypothetical protein